MPPFLLPLLLSMGPGILSSLGLMGSDPRKLLQQQLMSIYGPAHQQALTNQFYNQNLGSPAFSQGMGNIAAGVNATQGQLAGKLGAMGLGNTGTGALLSTLAPSISGSAQAGLRTGAYNSAQNQAQNTIQNQGQALMGTGGLPSQTQQYFGGGLAALMPFLQKLMSGGGGQQMGGLDQLMKMMSGGGAGANSIWDMLGGGSAGAIAPR